MKMNDWNVSPYGIAPDCEFRTEPCPDCNGQEKVEAVCPECEGAGITVMDIHAFPFPAEICCCEGQIVLIDCERCKGHGAVYPSELNEDRFER